MKKTIAVTVKYNVEYGMDIPDNIAEALDEIYSIYGGYVSEPDIYHSLRRDDLAKAAEWLAENIHEDDAMNIEYEIDELSDVEDDD